MESGISIKNTQKNGQRSIKHIVGTKKKGLVNYATPGNGHYTSSQTMKKNNESQGRRQQRYTRGTHERQHLNRKRHQQKGEEKRRSKKSIKGKMSA